MLNAPGAARNRPTPRTNRRKTQESPEEQVRALQRSNKTCADCSTKLPQCVNLTLGTFVCMACSGIHRELNMRVKGIGASTFSQEEIDKLKETSNDQVNAAYLARYDPRVDRLEPPTNNYDQQRLRLWIRRKYHDKAWLSVEPQPTRVEIPPKQETKTPPPDFLGFSNNTNAAAPTASAPAAQQWDAFNGSSQQPQQQQQATLPADFGSSHTKQQQSFAAFGQQPPQQQQQNMSSFGQQNPPPQQQQQNMSSFGQQHPSPQQQQNFAAFGQQQNFAAFGSQQQQPTQPQQQGQFADFSGHSLAPAPQQQFANFAQTQAPPSQPQQPTQFATYVQQTNIPQQQQQMQFGTPTQTPQLQGQFPAFSQHQQPPPPPPNQGMMQPPQQQHQQQSGAFGTFAATADAHAAAPPDQAQMPPAPPVAAPAAIHGPGTSGDRISDAFSNLMASPNAPKEASTSLGETQEKMESKYASGETVIYSSNGDKSVVKIVKVHLDDELEPFYTIELPDGREKQTDDAHLSIFVETAEAKDIANMLIGLDVTQLKKVVEFVKSLSSSNESASSTTALTSSTPVPSTASPAPSHAMPPAPEMAPPVPPLSPPASAPAAVQMGQFSTPAVGGPIGMQQGASAIPSHAVYSNQMTSDATLMGGVPVPPLYQQQGIVGQTVPQQQQFSAQQQPPPQQQQYMQQQQPPQQQQYLQQEQPPQQQQYLQQQQPPQQQQFMQQPPPQQQFGAHPPQQQFVQQQPTQQPQYMQQQQFMPQQQQYMQQQSVPRQLPGSAPLSPKGNPFDVYE